LDGHGIAPCSQFENVSAAARWRPGSVAAGDMITMVEADDFIMGFEHQIPKRRRAAQYG